MRCSVKLLMAAAVVALSACGAGSPVSRGDHGSQVSVSSAAVAPAMRPKYAVVETYVSVPRTLVVSEANLFFPSADIVWRGERPGDRHAQIHAIMSEALEAGTAKMTSGQPVIVEAEVVRFHSLTEKARYTIGGVHSLRFRLTVRDAATGAVLEGPRLVVADVRAAGGDRAMAEDQMGLTQRVVIVSALTRTLRETLSVPVTLPEAPAVSASASRPLLQAM